MGCECSRESTYEDFESPDDTVIGQEKFKRWKERLVLAPLTPGGDAVIGSGASCKIYRVQDRKYNEGPPQQIGYRNTTWTRPRPEFLALKVMDGTQSHIRRMWYNEVCNLRHLAPLTSSRHLVEFVDAYRYSNYYYILTAFYPGGDLFSAVENMGAQQSNELDAAKVLRDMFRALFACHSHGVTHRDVKPENFVFDVTGNETSLRLIDFGCSKFGPDEQVLKDKPQSVYYVAPEVLAPDTANEPRYGWRRCLDCSELYLCPPQPSPYEEDVGPNDTYDEDDEDASKSTQTTEVNDTDPTNPTALTQPQIRKRKVCPPEVGSGMCANGKEHRPDPNGRYRLRRPAGYNPQPDGSSGPSPTDKYTFRLSSGVAVFAPCSACGSLVCADRNVPGQAYCRATRSIHQIPLTTPQDTNSSSSMGLDGLVSPTVAPAAGDMGPTPFTLPAQGGTAAAPGANTASSTSPTSSGSVNPKLSELAAHSSYGLLTRGLRPGVRKVLREGGWKVCACCAVVYRAPLIPLNTARNPALLQKEVHNGRHITHDDAETHDDLSDPARQEIRERRAADAVAVVNDHANGSQNSSMLTTRLDSVTTLLPDGELLTNDTSITRERGNSRISEASTTVLGSTTDHEMSVSQSTVQSVAGSGHASRSASGSVSRTPNSRTRSNRVSRSSSRSSRGSSESVSSTPGTNNRSVQNSSSSMNPYELPFDLRVEFDPSLTKQLEVQTCPFALARTLPRQPRSQVTTGCFSNRGACGFLFGDDDVVESSTSRKRSSSTPKESSMNEAESSTTSVSEIRIDVPESEDAEQSESVRRDRAQQLAGRLLHRPFTYPPDEDSKATPEAESSVTLATQPIFLNDPIEELDDDVYEETMRVWGRHTPLDLDGFGEMYEDEAEDILLQLETFAENEGDGRGHISPMAGPAGSLSPRRRFEAARALNIDLDGDGKPLFALTLDGNPSRRGTEFFIEVSRTMNIGMWKRSDMWSMGVVMYVLLTGCAPFYSQDFHKIPGIISACDWTMPQDLSLAAKDLLSRLLQRDPMLRPTAWQVLHHPWLHTAFHKSSRPLKHLAAALADLRYHDDSSHLRRIFARAIITQQLHDESRFDEVKSVLSAFDHDGDGELSVDDVASLVAVLEDRKNRAQRAKAQAAKAKKQQQTTDGFLNVPRSDDADTSGASASPSLNSVSDGDGFLLPIEAIGLGPLAEEAAPAEGSTNPLDSIQGVKPELSLRHVDFATQAMQNLILTRENKLSYTELKVIIAAATLGTPSSFLGEISSVFQLLDTKHDGYLDHDELSAACSSFLSRDEVSDLLVVMDENGDGKINLREFTRALSRQSHLRRGGSPQPGLQGSGGNEHSGRDNGADESGNHEDMDESDAEVDTKTEADGQDTESTMMHENEGSAQEGLDAQVDFSSDAMVASSSNPQDNDDDQQGDDEQEIHHDAGDDSMVDRRTPVGVGGAQSLSTDF